ncbi:transcription factor Zn, C2H2 [Metarhizium brunneum]
MVIELLEMILRNLHRIDCKPEGLLLRSPDVTTSYSEAQRSFLTIWENASQGVDSALDRLHIVAVAIRKASAKKLNHTVTTILPEQDVAFRKDMASLIRYRFPAAREGLCQQLGDYIAARRRMLLQKKRHAIRLVVRRVPKTVSLANQGKDHHLKTTQATAEQGKDRRPPNPTVVTGLKTVSRPDMDPEAPAIKRLQLPSQGTMTTAISTISTTQQDSFIYPPPPAASE